MNWSQQPLEQLCLRVTSGGTPATTNPNFYGGDIPWLRTQEINFGFVDDTEIKITEAGLAGSAAKWISENSVIVALYGNSAGRVAVNKIPITTNQACGNFTIDPGKADYRFVYYALLKDYDILHAMSRGAAQNNLNLAMVKRYRLLTPDLPTQQRIGDLLIAYDDSIENNRRRMKLLEESARLVYQEWFVRLRFPGHEHLCTVEGLPIGWRKAPLGAITTKIGSGSTPRGGSAGYLSEGIALIRSLNVYNDRFEDQGLAFISDDQAEALEGVAVLSRDILLNITGASVARCCMAPDRYLPARVNQHVMIIRVDPEKANPFLVHAALNSDERKRQLLSYAQKGSTREALTKEMLGRFEITLPPTGLMLQFGEIAEALFRQRETLALQNQKLTTARDLLLPRLMNGEISV